MIHSVSGDLLLSRAEAIVHGVAPGDHFSQGLALSLRERWPAMARDFRHWCHTHHPEPGAVWMWAGPGSPKFFQLLTQAAEGHGGHPGKATLEHVHHALKALHRLLVAEPVASLAIPKLATGVGGLDWKAVRPLIERHLGSLDFPVYLYEEFHAGVAAKEPELAGRDAH